MSNYSIKVLTPLNYIQYNFILVIINDFKEKELKVLKKKNVLEILCSSDHDALNRRDTFNL